MCFCLSTAFEGHYLGSYYIEVNNLERPQIGRHCIPVVIPLAEISAAHLQTSLKKFLSLLFDHINAFAGRKYQADRLQDSPGACVPGTLRKNSLHTVLTFSYNVTLHGQNLLFSAKLLYRDVTAVLPTEALVTCPENVESAQEAASSHSSLFRRMPLHRALESLAKEEDTPSFS
ncbi:hypothetical protein GDO78_021188 [Eleutherodactylus coqui]|uniref:Centromere protein O n=1 Tax=Eleutherodactylus coqui TaxID=57060 RepID=A0A8J6EH30_ELECQ|nr:hypothetical protein GDO78_021188 [Eleutherodactylus coqui]